MTIDNNFQMSGDEARALMSALASSAAPMPCATITNLLIRLMQISQVQPPTQQDD